MFRLAARRPPPPPPRARSFLLLIGHGLAEQLRHEVEHLVLLQAVDDPARHVRPVRLAAVDDLLRRGVRKTLLERAASIIVSGVTLITLLALSDDRAPVFDPTNAADLAGLGSPAIACTPDLFPELIAAAIRKQEIGHWAAGNDLTTARSAG